LRSKTLVFVLLFVFLVLLVAGIRFGDLGENLFNGSVL
jgi:hypothetical protein